MGIYDQGSGSPVDFQLEQAKIDRQRAIVQAMQTRAMSSQQGQMVSGHYVSPGLAGMLSQIGMAAMSRNGMDQVDKSAASLGNQYNEGLKGALGDYLDTKMGKPAGIRTNPDDVANLMNNDVNLPDPSMQPQAAANPRKAAIDALASQFKPLQAVGTQDLGILAKNDPFDQAMARWQATQPGAVVAPTAAGQVPQAPGQPGAIGGSGIASTAAAMPGAAPTIGAGGPPVAGQTAPVSAPLRKGFTADQDPTSPLTHFFPNLGNREAMSLILTDPTRASAAKANVERGNSVTLRGDGLGSYNPVSHQYDQMIDIGQQAGQVEAGKLNAQNQGNFETITRADGTKLTISKAQLAAATGQGPVVPPGANGVPQAAAPAPSGRLTEGNIRQYAGLNSNGYAGSGATSPADLAELDKAIAGTTNPTTKQLLQSARQQVVENMPSQQSMNQTPPPPPGGGLVSGMTPANEKEQTTYGGDLGTSRKAINDNANIAMSVRARVAQMRLDTQGFQTGTLTPYKQAFGGLALALGADTDYVTKHLGNIADMQSFNKEALSLAFDQVKTLGSRQAMGIVEMALKANAGLTTQPDAASKILGMVDGMANFAMAKQQGAEAWAAQHGGSIGGFEANWNATQPITKYVDVSTMEAPAPVGQVNKPGPITPGAAKAPAGWSIKKVN